MRFWPLTFAILTLSCTPPEIDSHGEQVVEVGTEALHFKYQPPIAPYPKEAREANIEGDVRLSLLIDQEGKVVSAKAISGTSLFQKAAEDWWSQCQFSPHLVNNKPRTVRVTVNTEFRSRKKIR